MEWPKRATQAESPEPSPEAEVLTAPTTIEEFDAQIKTIEGSIASFKKRVEAHTEHGEDLFDAASAEQVLAMGAEVERLKAERDALAEASEERMAA